MIIQAPINLKNLFDKKEKYPWDKPEACPNCGSSRLWGHGFRDAYFEEQAQPFRLRIYRCEDCGKILRLRPKGYFPRFQVSIATIRSSIARKFKANKWLPGISRSRQAHWFKALKQRALALFGCASVSNLLKAFDALVAKGVIPVKRIK